MAKKILIWDEIADTMESFELVPTVYLGGAGADNTKYLRGDQTWVVPTFGSLLKFLATPANKINWTAVQDWTDVDISSDTGADTAIAALVNLQLDFYGHSSADYEGYVRKNGSAVTDNLARVRGRVYPGSVVWQAMTDSSCIIVPVDANEIFEAKLAALVTGTISNLTFKIDLLGYFV